MKNQSIFSNKYTIDKKTGYVNPVEFIIIENLIDEHFH